VAGLERLNPEVDVRRKRRALTAEEIGKLVASARSSGIRIQRFTGEQRARIYILSYMTGLRKNELGSLTPRSFRLDDSPPTLTVDASSSKHRKKDVLPIHPELVALLRGWLKGMLPNQRLFPRLGLRKAAVMVRKDLARVGIPYENDDGVADFHAAGRHTHITELLRNGTSLPEAKELARHADIKMTMRYTHIGLADQAKAVARLPSPRTPQNPLARAEQEKGPALHGRCISGVSGCPNLASGDNPLVAENDKTPCGSRELGIERRSLSQHDKIGTAGFEPTTSCTPSKRASQAAPRPAVVGLFGRPVVMAGRGGKCK
jgi:hypothetical protein